MIGIIVSGSAVPTAASTEPTAPWARLSLRPNHSMPLVNSSAPSRMTTNATSEDEDVHVSPPARWRPRSRPARPAGRGPTISASRQSRAATNPSARDDHPPDGQRDHEQDPAHRKPAGRSARMSAGMLGRVERRDGAVGERVDAAREHQRDADGDERPSRATCPPGAGARSRLEGVRGVGSGAGRPRAPSQAERPHGHLEGRVQRGPPRTASAGPAGRSGGARREPAVAPANTPSAIGPAMYGSISSRSR